MVVCGIRMATFFAAHVITAWILSNLPPIYDLFTRWGPSVTTASTTSLCISHRLLSKVSSICFWKLSCSSSFHYRNATLRIFSIGFIGITLVSRVMVLSGKRLCGFYCKGQSCKYLSQWWESVLSIKNGSIRNRFHKINFIKVRSSKLHRILCHWKPARSGIHHLYS